MPEPTLSPPEHEVLRQIAEGNTTKSIAEKLSIGRRTVECHRLSIRRKACLLSRSKTALFQFARRYFGKSGGGGDNLLKKNCLPSRLPEVVFSAFADYVKITQFLRNFYVVSDLQN